MWTIWTKVYKNGKYVGGSMYVRMYARKGYAERIAKERFGRTTSSGMSWEWCVSEENPFKDANAVWQKGE